MASAAHFWLAVSAGLVSGSLTKPGMPPFSGVWDAASSSEDGSTSALRSCWWLAAGAVWPLASRMAVRSLREARKRSASRVKISLPGARSKMPDMKLALAEFSSRRRTR